MLSFVLSFPKTGGRSAKCSTSLTKELIVNIFRNSVLLELNVNISVLDFIFKMDCILSD